MARENNTPAGFWLDMPLVEFTRWIKANNEIVREFKELREKRKKKR